MYVLYVVSLLMCSDEELDNQTSEEPFELDTLDTEKVLLLTDEDGPL